jgi:isoleucyl-tRNA synthetase
LSKNVIVEGVILGTDGRKMSKNFGNYPDPKEMIGKYGGDALRLYLMGSPVMKGEDIIISEEQYKSQVRGIMLVLWNVYNFFITYANAEEWEKVKKTNQESSNVLDKWLLSLTQRLVKEVTVDLEQFDTISAINRVSDFINKMSTWYIRRSRDRVRNDVEDLNDKEVFFATTFKVLITLAQVLAPLAPFLAESIYRNLTGKDSVHLSDWPVVSQNFINNSLEEEMEMAILLASKTHSFRKEAQIKVRIPFKTLSHKSFRCLIRQRFCHCRLRHKACHYQRHR